MVAAEVIETAAVWRHKYDCVGRGGVIIVYNNVAEAWVNQIRNAERWRPGCIAIDENGKTWTAVGGSEQDVCVTIDGTWQQAHHLCKEGL